MMWTDIAIAVSAITVGCLCGDNWLIWKRLAKFNSRLETLEACQYSQRIFDDLKAWDGANAENIHDRGDGKNNASPRIYGRD